MHMLHCKTRWYPSILAPIMSLIVAVLAPAAQAMSFLPVPDEALLRQSDLVVQASVAAAVPAPGHEHSAVQYSLQVEQALKGVPPAALNLLVPGALDPTQHGAVTIPGTPVLAPGEEVLAFLDRRADGSYVLVHLGLGAFHVLPGPSGAQLLQRDLAQADAIDPANGEPLATTPRYRDLQKFGAWLRQQAAGVPAEADYWSDEAPAGPVVLPRFKVSSPPARWFQFDSGQTVTFYATTPGQVGLADGGYPEFKQAMVAWDNNGAGNVYYVYGGTTTATGDLDNPDGINKILFNDPDELLGGVFDCINGGIAGYGGWVTDSTQEVNGVTYQVIQQADATIRNGAGCLLSQNNETNATELFGHELGHTLGLLHPCGDPDEAECVAGSVQDQALMRPWIHADGRGARLDSDDLAGIAFLYDLQPQSVSSDSGTSSTTSSSGGGAADPWVCAGLLLLAAARRIQSRLSTRSCASRATSSAS
jgi:hypothetical protein